MGSERNYLQNKAINEAGSIGKALTSGAVNTIGWSILERIFEQIDDRQKKKLGALLENEHFSRQLICRCLYKKISKHKKFSIFDMEGNQKYYFIYNRKSSCFICNDKSYKIGRIERKRTFFLGTRGFVLYQGTQRIGFVNKNLSIFNDNDIEFNGWQLHGYDKYCDIFDKNNHYIAQIKRESFNNFIRGRRSAPPHYTYVLNYNDQMYEVFCLMLISMFHFS